MLGKTDELLVLLVIILVLFGGKKLPELSRSIGQSIKEIRKSFTEVEDVVATAKTSVKKTDK